MNAVSVFFLNLCAFLTPGPERESKDRYLKPKLSFLFIASQPLASSSYLRKLLEAKAKAVALFLVTKGLMSALS